MMRRGILFAMLEGGKWVFLCTIGEKSELKFDETCFVGSM